LGFKVSGMLRLRKDTSVREFEAFMELQEMRAQQQ
jgi:hypothetical protein